MLTQAFASQLPTGVIGGNVINIIDQRVWNPTPYFVSYTLSKAGLWTMTRTLALALASLLPLYWMIIGSFKIQTNAMAVPPEFWPSAPTLENWQKLLFGRSPTWRWLLNSIAVASISAALAVLTSALAGYAFGKKDFPGRKLLFWLIIITMMLPKQISLIPLFILMRKQDWFNTYQGMIVPWIAYPFGIFLFKQYMQSIPNELIEAARIDGAGELRTFFNIVLPLSKPAIGALSIFAFVAAWNDFLWQLILVTERNMFTLPVGVSKLVSNLSNYNLGLAMAGATFAFIPMLIVFLAFQDYFVKGITLGAVKG
jgi:multiple sugar transport system permease protein